MKCDPNPMLPQNVLTINTGQTTNRIAPTKTTISSLIKNENILIAAYTWAIVVKSTQIGKY